MKQKTPKEMAAEPLPPGTPWLGVERMIVLKTIKTNRQDSRSGGKA